MSAVRNLPSAARRREWHRNSYQLEMRASGMDNRHPSDLDIATPALCMTTYIVALHSGLDVGQGYGH